MNVGGTPRRTIRSADGYAVEIIDQTLLPARFALVRLDTLGGMAEAIGTMRVRGAPLIGVAAAYGMAIALHHDPTDAGVAHARATLLATRPTAVNLAWALETVSGEVLDLPVAQRAAAALARADRMAEDDVAACRSIGEHGAKLLEARAAEHPGRPLQVMTHCNAGWLATVDYGTALAPVYLLHDAGIPVHVWVSETRPRNQGLLTAWELTQHGVPCTIIVDNAAGLLLERGQVDVVIVGTDRTTASGDVTNKIGTYLKALAAREARVPFFVAAPSSSIDWRLTDGRAVPIEERAAAEVSGDAALAIRNPAFDVTPARLVTAIITERGACPASAEGLRGLFPERAP